MSGRSPARWRVSTGRPSPVIWVCPGWRLHPLKGELAGFWRVTINGNWRVAFRFENGDATDVDYLDYH